MPTDLENLSPVNREIAKNTNKTVQKPMEQYKEVKEVELHKYGDPVDEPKGSLQKSISLENIMDELNIKNKS